MKMLYIANINPVTIKSGLKDLAKSRIKGLWEEPKGYLRAKEWKMFVHSCHFADLLKERSL